MHRRDFLAGLSGATAVAAMPTLVQAKVPLPYDWNASPPFDDRQVLREAIQNTQG